MRSNTDKRSIRIAWIISGALHLLAITIGWSLWLPQKPPENRGIRLIATMAAAEDRQFVWHAPPALENEYLRSLAELPSDMAQSKLVGKSLTNRARDIQRSIIEDIDPGQLVATVPRHERRVRQADSIVPTELPPTLPLQRSFAPQISIDRPGLVSLAGTKLLGETQGRTESIRLPAATPIVARQAPYDSPPRAHAARSPRVALREITKIPASARSLRRQTERRIEPLLNINLHSYALVDRPSPARNESPGRAPRISSTPIKVELTAVAGGPVPDLPTGPFTPPAVRRRTAAFFPIEILRSAERKSVTLEVLVLVNGRSGGTIVQTSSGSLALDRAAINAVRRWTFEPATRGATPVEATLTVVVELSPKRR